MELIYRRMNLESDQEVRWVSEVDVTIPAMYDPDFKIDEKMVKERIESFKKFQNDDFLEVVTIPDGLIVGFHVVKKAMFFDQPVGNVYTLWVSPEYRRRGIGAMLKSRAEEWARTKKLEYIYTHTSKNNPSMLALNESHGFEVVSYRLRKKL